MKRIFILVFMLVVIIGFSQEKKVYRTKISRDLVGKELTAATKRLMDNAFLSNYEYMISKDVFEKFLISLSSYILYEDEIDRLLIIIEKENNIEIRRR